MDKMVKKSIEFGVGVASITASALADAVSKLEKKGKISPKEGERMVREAAKRYQAQSVKYAKEVRAQIDGMVKSAPFATRREIEELSAKIDAVIKQVNKTGKASKPSRRRK